MSCVLDEFTGADFNDERLTKRLYKVAELFGDRPNKSFPAATAGGRADLEGAYRFVNNPKVSPKKILATHTQKTIERINASDSDLIVIKQDTSKCDLTRPNQQVAGAGYLGGSSRRGIFLHPLMASTLERVPLGIVGQQNFIREEISKLSKAEKQKQRDAKPIDEKESYRWIQGLRQAKWAAQQCLDKTCVLVQDSEADINELLCEDRRLPGDHQLHLIVRGGQDRSTTQGKLMEVLRSQPVRFEQLFEVSGRKPKVACTQHKREKARQPRTARVDVRATTVDLCPSRGSARPSYNVVLVEENSTPGDCEPIQWVLITSLPIDHIQQIQQVIEAYCVRWQIEIFFRVLKTGCRIEKRHFETIEAIENVIALFMVIAWRVMYLSMLGRTCPDISCELFFEDYEWWSVYRVLGKPIPDTPPTLGEVVRTIAQLGGFIDRTKNEPGPETLWKGIQVAFNYASAWLAFGPEKPN